MSLSNSQKKQFRTIGHGLTPVVTIASKGLTPAVIDEINRALNDHELIKIKVVAEKDSRKALIQDLCEQCAAELIQEIGKVALILRFAKRRNDKLSNLTRA